MAPPAGLFLRMIDKINKIDVYVNPFATDGFISGTPSLQNKKSRSWSSSSYPSGVKPKVHGGGHMQLCVSAWINVLNVLFGIVQRTGVRNCKRTWIRSISTPWKFICAVESISFIWGTVSVGGVFWWRTGDISARYLSFLILTYPFFLSIKNLSLLFCSS